MSGGFDIPLHRRFVFEGTTCLTYKGRARNPERSYLFLDGHGIQFAFTGPELAAVRADNSLRDWTPAADPEATRGERDHGRLLRITWTNALQSEREAAARQLEYCMAWYDRPGTPRTPSGLAPIIAAVHARRVREAPPSRPEGRAPCVSSLQKWLRKWLLVDRNIDALVPTTRLRGNRDAKLPPDLDGLIHDFIDEHYLTRERKPVAEVHRQLERHFGLLNGKRSLHDKLKGPSYEAVRQAVAGLCPFTVDFCRLGERIAVERWRAINSGIVTTHANEVWEMDDTRVDLICVGEDGKTIIGRPWVIVVIDRFSRMIMAAVVTFSPPDTTSAMEALSQAILNKREMLARLGLDADYEACGRPDTIHVDNAKHYNSVALKTGLARLGINHRTMPVLKAWYRAVVERAIGTMSRQVFHVVPGTTHAGIYERDRETPPETVAETTIGELRHKLWRWIVFEYSRREHKGISDTPLNLWRASQRTTLQRLPMAREDVENAMSLTVARTLRKEGLQFIHLVYHSEELVRARLLPKSRAAEEVLIRVDRTNLEVIHFLDPSGGGWHPAYLRRDLLARVRGRTLEEYNLARAARLSRSQEFNDADPDWTRIYEELEASLEQAAQAPTLGPRVKAEGRRERLLGSARHLTAPEAAQDVPVGGDLSSMVDQAIGGGTYVVPEPDADATVRTDGAAQTAVADWAARRGLRSRVRKPGKGD